MTKSLKIGDYVTYKKNSKNSKIKFILNINHDNGTATLSDKSIQLLSDLKWVSPDKKTNKKSKKTK